MLKLVTVAEARQTRVNNLGEHNCKAYVHFIHLQENHLAYLNVFIIN